MSSAWQALRKAVLLTMRLHLPRSAVLRPHGATFGQMLVPPPGRPNVLLRPASGACCSPTASPALQALLLSRPCSTHAAVDGSSGAAAAAEEQQPEEEQQQSQPVGSEAAPEPADADASPTPEPMPGPVAWPTFLEVLWDRGYFAEFSSAGNKSAAVTDRRDIKKALQQLGRARTDIVLLLPQPLLLQLAALPFPERLEKKAVTGLKRLRAAAAAAATAGAGEGSGTAMGAASTQDVLRILWCLADIVTEGVSSEGSSDDGSSSKAAAAISDSNGTAVLEALLQEVLNHEQQPPNEALMAQAAAAAATPDLPSYEKHQSVRLAAVADATAAAVAERGRRLRGDAGISSSGGRDSRDSRAPGRGERGDRGSARPEPWPRSEDPAVLHRIRMLRSAAFIPMRQGDWFCGQCGTHNFSFKATCFRCEVPSNSLGVSKVTANDVRQLQQVGLGDKLGAPHQRDAAAAFARRLAESLDDPSLSIPAAARAAGLGKFVAPPADAGGSGADGGSGSGDAAEGQQRSSRGSWGGRDGRRDGPSSSSSSSSRDGGGSVDRAGDRGRDSRDRDSSRRPERDGRGDDSRRPVRDGRGDDSRGSSSGGGGSSDRRLFRNTGVRTEMPQQPQQQETSSSSSSLKDALREAFAGLDVDGAFGPASTSTSTSSVRRVRRQQPSDEGPGASSPEAAAGGDNGAGSYSSRQTRQRSSADVADSDDLGGWAAEYGHVVPAGAAAPRQPPPRYDEQRAGGQDDSRGSGERRSSSSSRSYDDGARGGRRGARGGSDRDGRGGTARGGERRRDEQQPRGGSKPSWASIFKE